jgi:hypothetical protein
MLVVVLVVGSIPLRGGDLESRSDTLPPSSHSYTQTTSFWVYYEE